MDTDIYKYDDYRLFLGDRYRARTEEEPGYSYRRFAREAGFTNPGFLNDVVKGRRTLSAEAVEKMARGLRLTPTETDFFRLLVRYGQARTEPDREAAYREIVARRNRSRFTRLHPSLVKYYQDCRYPLVRVAIMACDFRGDYDRLARFLDPPLPVPVVKKVVRDLCDWGLVEQDTEGKYSVTSAFVEPPDTLAHLNQEMNREWIRHAFAAVRRFPADRRHASTMVLSVSRPGAAAIMERIERFRKEILDMVETDTPDEQVVQLSIQFFPKSKTRGERQ